jgi:WD40 repeat protein
VNDYLSDWDRVTPQAKATVKAHDKDINTIAVSPNDKIIATGSQDRTIKVKGNLDSKNDPWLIHSKHSCGNRTGCYSWEC